MANSEGEGSGRRNGPEAGDLRFRRADDPALVSADGNPVVGSHFQTVADSIDQMIWSTRPDGFHDYFNRRWYEYTGVPEGSTDGEEWNGMFHPDDQQRAWAVWAHCLDTGEPYHIEYRLRHRSGEYRWVLGRAQPVRNEAGEIVRWYGTCTDIHDLKIAQERLLTSEARVREVLEGMGEGFVLFSPQLRLLDINAEGERIDGRPKAEIIGKHLLELWPESEKLPTLPAYQRALAEQRPQLIEYRHLSDQHDVWLEVRAYPVATGLAVFYRDISARKHAQAEVEAASARSEKIAAEQSAILGQLSEGVIVTDPEGRISFVNEAAERLHGVKLLGVAPDAYTETYHLLTEAGEPHPPHELPLARAAIKGETVVDARWRIRRPDGTEVLAIGSARPIRLPSGETSGAVLTARDDTQRFSAEQALRESEERLRLVVDGARDYAIITMAPDRRITSWSKGAAAIFGFSAEEVVGQSADIIFTPEDRAAGAPDHETETAREEGCASDERWHVRADGSLVFMSGSVHPLPPDVNGRERGFIKIVQDDTERRAADAALRDSEARLRIVQAAGGIGSFDYDLRKDEAICSPEYYALFGLPEGAPITLATWNAVIHPEDREQAVAALQSSISERRPFDYEYRIVRADTGEVRWLSGRANVVFDADGRPWRYVGGNIDVTGRRAAEEALREESRTLETLNQTGAALAAELDLDKLVQMVTDAGVSLTGAHFGAFFYNVAEGGELMMLYTLSGAERSQFDAFGMPRATAIFSPTFAGEGPIRSDDILTDPRYGKNHPHKGMPEGHLPVRSYLAVPVTSRSGEVIGGLFFGHPAPGRFAERHERLVVGIAGQAAIGIDNARLYKTAQKELGERVAAQERLRELNDTLELRIEERTRELDRVWNVSQDLFVICGFDGFYRLANPAWAEQLGYQSDTLVGTAFDALVHPSDLAATRREFERLVGGEVVQNFDIRLRAANGDYRWYSWTCVPERDVFYAAGRDVTERKHLEEQLRQAQKMETLGQLTGGVAHDFNNLLQIVTGNLEILQRNLPQDQARLRRSAENAMRGAERAAVLTQRLLAFARRQPLEPRPINLNGLVGGMSELLHQTLGEAFEIETVLASGLWSVEADPNQLENAIINLAVNARDAMGEGGKLTIETANAHLDHGYAAQNTGVAPGQYVVICVSDTGSGMDEATLQRVFEPFFTTKDVGRGTGLGLSMVYGFVKQSGGHVKIYSEAGQGTSVKLYLPRLIGAVAEEEAVADPLVPEGTREETILVCEDDDDVRTYSVEVLRELGYRVLEAHDGPSALRLLERQGGEVDLLFTDVVLPSGMLGDQLATEARAIRPGLKVLFTTGYARNAIVHQGRLDPGVELITKPFSYADLAGRVRDLLDQP
ncbi:MAG TPA: PAS domain S-box protein [Allosphingosinicella sp.]|uniref:PAS domain S-box protein n=1 Tax=Allosphingosinicella sp. TaxID=2823234 RepID=UPI002F2AD452